ncbi:MAG: hypothetical protein HY676_03140 [Chloroflexi bacterium]|nr:hypothetical protein [Chloroflexota bacterium]
MPVDISLARVFHIVAFVMMAAPMYMLIVVNERARMGPPDAKMDRYMENIITRNSIRCFIFQGTVLGSGLILVWLLDYGMGAVASNWVILSKLVGTLLLVALLSYVHFYLQPQINRMVDGLASGNPPPPELPALRRRRKRLSATCLFILLSMVVLGLRLSQGLEDWLTILLVGLAAIFAWRVYSSLVRLGWV